MWFRFCLLFCYFYFIKFVVQISEGNVSIMHVPNPESSTSVSDPTARACHWTLIELFGTVQIPILVRKDMHTRMNIWTAPLIKQTKICTSSLNLFLFVSFSFLFEVIFSEPVKYWPKYHSCNLVGSCTHPTSVPKILILSGKKQFYIHLRRKFLVTRLIKSPVQLLIWRGASVRNRLLYISRSRSSAWILAVYFCTSSDTSHSAWKTALTGRWSDNL